MKVFLMTVLDAVAGVIGLTQKLLGEIPWLVSSRRPEEKITFGL